MKKALLIGLMLMSVSALGAPKSNSSSRRDDPGLKGIKQTACHMRAALTLDGCTDPSCMKATGASKNKAGGTDGSKKGG